METLHRGGHCEDRARAAEVGANGARNPYGVRVLPLTNDDKRHGWEGRHLRDETWPTEGIASSLYSRQKARVERLLDEFEVMHRSVRVVRFRPALIFKRNAAARVRKLFLGRLPPRFLFDARFLRRMIDDHPAFRFQAVHASDVAEAFRLALFSDARGPFNLAADSVLDSDTLSRTFGARRISVRPGVLRALVSVGFRLRSQPADPGWIDLCFHSPILDASRAYLLGWEPAHSSVQALLEILDGLRAGASVETPLLSPEAAPRLVTPGGGETAKPVA